VQVHSNVKHGRVVECAQHSHFKPDGTDRACEVSISAVEVPKSASNYLIIGSTAECPSLDRQSNTEQSLSFFKPNVAVLSRRSGLLSHQDGQGGCDSVASSCASAIFCGTTWPYFNAQRGELQKARGACNVRNGEIREIFVAS
jgi:hypothetical protein